MNIKQANAERFNAIAAEWDGDPEHVYRSQKVARAMRAALPLTGSERALELAAGTGLVTLVMAARLGHVTAMDSSAEMLAVLREKCELKQLEHVQTLEGFVPEQLPDGPFDLVYSAMTLHHVEDVPGLLVAVAARIRPGGLIALADLDREDGSFHGDGSGVAHHGFDRAEFGDWLRQAGFVDIAFSTAFTIHEQREDGMPHDYPIFLAVARKADA